jgi:UDP-N-acetylmuramoyl-L-alanyl-D-glutamate--2,6-diaminopimelate ligase
MGSVAEELADWVVVTSDNPRSESPDLIAAEIVSGMRQGNHEVILNRAEAIQKAVLTAQSRDIVLIAGKGHETTQVIGEKSLPFDDVSIARSALEARPAEFGR